MSSLQEVSRKVVIAENLYHSFQKTKKSFIIFDEPEIIKLVIAVLKGREKISFVQLSDYQIYVL